MGIMADAWSSPVTGSSFFVWEEKLRRLKKSLNTLAKTIDSSNQKKTQAALLLETHQFNVETKIIDKEDLKKELKLQNELHAACRQEAEW